MSEDLGTGHAASGLANSLLVSTAVVATVNIMSGSAGSVSPPHQNDVNLVPGCLDILVHARAVHVDQRNYPLGLKQL